MKFITERKIKLVGSFFCKLENTIVWNLLTGIETSREKKKRNPSREGERKEEKIGEYSSRFGDWENDSVLWVQALSSKPGCDLKRTFCPINNKFIWINSKMGWGETVLSIVSFVGFCCFEEVGVEINGP